jgi:Phage Terminase
VAMPLMSSSRDCPPRFATRRSRRESLGVRVDQVAGLLGQPLMPWQRDVLDVALEVDPETGLLAYRTVVLTVPRQSGKTWLLLCLMVHRALGFGEPQQIIYTAQNRLEARKKWEDDHVRRLERSPMRGKFTVRRQIGQEAIRWGNGSLHGISSSTEKSGHGSTLDLAVLDEAFAHEDSRLEQSLRPTMATRPEPQMWIVSTAGTDRSVFLRGKVAAGRAKAAADVQADSAFFDWSAPLDADPADPATWWGCMPALGHTIDESVVRAEFGDMELTEFRRAYLNQWPEASTERWDVIPKSVWESRGGAEDRPAGRVAFALSAAWPDAEFGSIAVVGRHGDEVYAQVVEHLPGTSWMPGRMRQLQDEWNPVAVVLDGKDPASRVKAELEAAGVNLTPLNMTEAGQAFGMFIAAVMGDAPYLRHYDQPVLGKALAGAVKRPLGDAHTWMRKGAADISPVVAVTHALYGLANCRTPAFFAVWR